MNSVTVRLLGLILAGVLIGCDNSPTEDSSERAAGEDIGEATDTDASSSTDSEDDDVTGNTDADAESNTDMDTDSDDDTGSDADIEAPDTRPFNHIIITSAELRDASIDYTLQDLADHRSAHGHRSMIVVVSDIYEKYAGRDPQEKIRNFIKDAHSIWGTQYFLIAGKDAFVPVRDLYVWDGAIASDYYYAALDGDFDANGDGMFGKYPADAPDVTPDVSVGRIPAKDAEQIANFVYKVITYENSPADSSYLTKAVLWTTPDVGQFPLRGTHPDWDQIHNAEHTTVEQRNNIDTHPFVFQRMSSGNYGLFIGGGHGWENLSCQLTSDDVDLLRNRDRYFLYTSISCFSGKFREDRSFNERLVVGSREGGAYATMLNSETGIPPQTCWLQDAMMQSVFTNGRRELGDILNDVRVQTTTRPGWYTFDDEITRHAIYAYNLFGDPATPFRMPSASAENVRFDFDEVSGNPVNDAHGTMADGALSGGVAQEEGGLRFDGSGCVSISDSPYAPMGNQAEAGIMAWINRGETAATTSIVGKGSAAQSFELSVAGDGRLRLSINQGAVINGEGGGVWWSNSLVAADQWTHVAATYNAWTRTVGFFINGVNAGTHSAELYVGQTPEALFIGCDPSGEISGFSGIIDEVRIYSSAIDEHDIAAAMN